MEGEGGANLPLSWFCDSVKKPLGVGSSNIVTFRISV